MIPLAWDTETALIRPAQMAPPLVCVSYQQDRDAPALVHWTDALPLLDSWLRDDRLLLIGHYVEYDATVICAQFPELVPLVFRAYRLGRVTCTKRRQQLLDIAGGVFRGRIGEKGKWVVHNYSLADLARRHCGITMVKDGWRYSYDVFRDVPLSGWTERARALQAESRPRLAELQAMAAGLGPSKAEEEAFEEQFGGEVKNLTAIIADVPEGAARYPLEDATATMGVFRAQEKHAAAYLQDQFRQSYAYFVLSLSSAWGIRTHAPGVETLKEELADAYDECKETLQELGYVRANGTRDMKLVKAAMIESCKELSLPLRRTAGHDQCTLGDACTEHVCLDADACDAVVDASGDTSDSPFTTYAEFVTLGKMLSNDVAMLASGTVYPVHTKYDLAETGRTTSSKPNIQNMNTGRMNKKRAHLTSQRLRPGVRQAFIPRPGKAFIQADFPQLELYTLAQCCYTWLGFSALGDQLNAGLDPHLAFAAQLLGISYQEASARKKDKVVDQARQIGKVFNFGKPGGLGNKKLITWARKTYGVIMSEEECKQYTAIWYQTLPEMRLHFARVNDLFGEDQERVSVETLFTQRTRGGATYCAACNNGFQALGVDCAKAALTLVAEAQYCDTASPLYGARTVAFVHDELIGEADIACAHDAAHEQARLMVEGANRYLPNVPIALSKMEPVVMAVWDKNARPLHDAAGRLVPWSPLLEGLISLGGWAHALQPRA